MVRHDADDCDGYRSCCRHVLRDGHGRERLHEDSLRDGNTTDGGDGHYFDDPRILLRRYEWYGDGNGRRWHTRLYVHMVRHDADDSDGNGSGCGHIHSDGNRL
jgi:hypothetical protein